MKAWIVSFALVTACATAGTPPAPTAERTPTTVNASFGRTWDAVIDEFARMNIPIRTVDRSSGFIATDRLRVTRDPRQARKPDPQADCGKDMLGTYGHPDEATYNVLVRGDSARATVRVTVAWVETAAPGRVQECSSLGVWESETEAGVKARAEARR